MSGALMQIVAYGAQDLFLTGSAEITFWKISYRRHTNYAIESIEQIFNGQADFGRRATCTLSRSGDLAYRTYLQITLPEINSTQAPYARWLDYIGEQIISQVEIEIGGQRIDRHYGDFMHIWNQLTMSSEQLDAYHKMIGHTTQLTYLTDPTFADISGPCSSNASVRQVCAPRKSLEETTLYIPLQFWFCTNPGLSLPLIALQYHDVKFNIDFRPIGECLWAVSSLVATAGERVASVSAYQQSLVAASLYVDYVFLDQDERRKMAQNPHEYLIEQLQFQGDDAVGSSASKLGLRFSHPCKEIIWVVQPDSSVDYCSSLISSESLFKTFGAQPFNYTDALDVMPKSYLAYAGYDAINGANEFVNASGDQFQEMFAYDVASYGASGWNNPSFAGPNGYLPGAVTSALVQQSTVSDAGTFVLAHTAHKLHCWGENPVVTAKIQFNGQDRFTEREGNYFDVVQNWQHHTRHPDTGINVYSFALKPEEYQPSGAMNFSRIDNAFLNLVLSSATVSGNSTAKVRIYTKNYNVLRVMSGMAGQAYAN